MGHTSSTIRIFISSPADVAEERDQAQLVIDGLQRRYPGVTLKPVLWEELALPATASFQENIDFLLEREPIDVAVFILWSRLGTPLGAATLRPDGAPYRSGTEREFDLMLAAYEKSGGHRPRILAYFRDDDAGFQQKLTESPESEWEKLIAQRKLAKAFIREQFYDAEGRNVRAVQTYREPAGFAQRLRVHLRQTLDELLGEEAAPRWLEEPYRGLEAFDIRHAAIFHGRDEETCEVLQRLRDQERGGCAFVVIVGASGSGKSSLARAGVAASLIEHAGDAGAKEWRAAILLPAAAGPGGLLAELTRTLTEALPELEAAGIGHDDFTAALAQDPGLTVKLSLAPALARASQRVGGSSTAEAQTRAVRLLLVLDQMEELWTDRRIAAEDRERFLRAIEALARSGSVAVLATLRSDFYPQAQALPTFLRLKGERGHYDLLPPGAAALGRLIAEPARLAGLQFEREEASGRALEEVILQDAAHHRAALPLLQYTLWELYRQRQEHSRRLTFAAYQQLGGVEGGLGRRAEETFRALGDEAQAALEDVLPLLVTVDTDGDQDAVRRRAALADLTSTPARRELTEALIAARFLTTDQDAEAPIASLAHEALLRRWDRLADWIARNREHLRLRSHIEDSRRRWEENDRHVSLLLPAGLPLEEGRRLINEAPHLLNAGTTDYIRLSLQRQERLAQRTRRRRRAVLGGLSALTALAMLAAGFAWLKQLEAERHRDLAQSNAADADQQRDLANRRAREANSHFQQSERQRIRAETEARVANAVRLALSAKDGMREFPQRSVLLAAHALAMLDEQDPAAARVTAHQALRDALGNIHGECLLHIADKQLDRLVVSPQGDWAALSAEDGSLYARNLDGAAPLLALPGHRRRVLDMAISPDGRWLATGGDDRQARLFDLSADDPPGSVVVLPHADDVASVAFSEDSRWLVTAGDEGVAQVWDLASNRVAQTGVSLPGHNQTVTVVGIRGRWLITHCGSIASGNALTLRLFDLAADRMDESGRDLAGPKTQVEVAALSPDGRWLASGGWDGLIRVWDLTAENIAEPVLILSEQSPSKLRVSSDDPLHFSPDSRWLVAWPADDVLRLWDLANEDVSASCLKLSQDPGGAKEAVVSGDGRWVVARNFHGPARLWDLAAGAAGLTSISLGSSAAFAFSADNHRLIGSIPRLHVWDLRAADIAASAVELHGHEDSIRAIHVVGAQHVLTLSSDHSVRRWTLAPPGPQGSAIVLPGQGEYTRSLHVTPDSRSLIVAGVRRADIWDLATPAAREPSATFGGENEIVAAQVSRDGQLLVTQDRENKAQIWDLARRNFHQPIRALDHSGKRFVRGPLRVAISDDGRWAATAGWNASRDEPAALLWDLTKDPIAPQAHISLKHDYQSVDHVAFSPDGKWLLTASSVVSVLWGLDEAGLTDRAVALDGAPDHPQHAVFTRDGKWLATRAKFDTYMWSLEAPITFELPRTSLDPLLATGKEWSDWLTDKSRLGKSQRIKSFYLPLDASPDSRWILMSEALFDVKSSQPAVPAVVLPSSQSGWGDTVLTGAFSADGRWLVTGGSDRIIIWDMREQDLESTMVVIEANGSQCAISPDQRWIITAEGEGRVYLWPLERDRLIDHALRIAGRPLNAAERKQFQVANRLKLPFPD